LIIIIIIIVIIVIIMINQTMSSSIKRNVNRKRFIWNR